MRILQILLIIILVLSVDNVLAYENLNKKNYEKSKNEKAVIIYGVNWGRKWGCAGLENAQIENLTFARLSSNSGGDNEEKIVLNTPSRLFVDNISKPYAIIVSPGEYALTGFKVKIAKSVHDVSYIKWDGKDLFENGKPFGGTFKADAGEIVYIGEFGLDCAYEPIPWRYYIQKEDFDSYVAGFKERYKFISDKQVIYRLFQTNKFGQ